MEIAREECTFVTGFCRQYSMVSLTQNLHFFTAEARFHLSGYMNTQNNRNWSSINLKQTSEVPLHNQLLVYGVPLLLHEF
jgi:hypothetical protein